MMSSPHLHGCRLVSDLAHRTLAPEIMDQPGLDPREHVRALGALARINFMSRSAGILWPEVSLLARSQPGKPLRMLDVACGGGDVPIQLWRKARSQGVALEVRACDISPVALEHARCRAHRLKAQVSFQKLDALRDPFPDDCDLITSSLFLHHLNDEQAVDLLRKMAGSARRLVLVNDLRRSRAGLLLAHAVTRLVSRSPVMHFDGPQSVRAAFSLAEIRDLAQRAGLKSFSIRQRWPFRFLLIWPRD